MFVSISSPFTAMPTISCHDFQNGPSAHLGCHGITNNFSQALAVAIFCVRSFFAGPQGPQFLRNPATLHALEHKHVHLLILAISRLVFESVK